MVRKLIISKEKLIQELEKVESPNWTIEAIYQCIDKAIVWPKDKKFGERYGPFKVMQFVLDSLREYETKKAIALLEEYLT